MKALDLFCGAGGASMGLYKAGFEVTGVDLHPQPRYPFRFRQEDVLGTDLGGFDLIWASPPCQRYIRGGLVTDQELRPDLIGRVRDLLVSTGVKWVIENVPGSPLMDPFMLCGSMFNLGVRRHRIFETNFPVWCGGLRCDHSYPVVGVYGHPHGKRGAYPGMLPGTLETWSEAMGIGWMSTKELSQAIPPAYSEFIANAAI